MNPTAKPPAVVLLSGGMDSAVVVAQAQEMGFQVHALSILYGQRHAVELAAASRVATALAVADHKVLELDLRAIGGSALTADIAVPEAPSAGIPVTYVPARNTIFLSLALGHAEVIGATDLFVGVNAVDYSGYPDCRPAFIEAFEHLANVATRAGDEGRKFRIHAPLMNLSKAAIALEGQRLGVDLAQTVSCYQADRQGQACARCDACRLRRQGFLDAGLGDPTRYRPDVVHTSHQEATESQSRKHVPSPPGRRCPQGG